MTDVTIIVTDVTIIMTDVTIITTDVIIIMTDVTVLMTDVTVLMTDVTYHVPVRGGAHHAAEGDDWRDAGEVQEDDGRETLHMERVFEVAEEVRITSLHVVDQTAEEPGEKTTIRHAKENIG